jgi:hypothetical protein
MRWLVLGLLVGCSTIGIGDDGAKRPSLDGPYACGSKSCSTGQICVTGESGSQCQVNYDAGIGQYQTYSWTCVDVPAECDGIPSCDCVTGPGLCFGPSEDGRTIAFGCI